MAKFVGDSRIDFMLKVARLISYLENTEDKAAKIAEIKAARSNGLINDMEAVDLTIEFC